jgi:hypothetical protein
MQSNSILRVLFDQCLLNDFSFYSGRGMKPVHQKPPSSNKLHNRPHKLHMSPQEKQDWRRKKLVKRSRTNM